MDPLRTGKQDRKARQQAEGQAEKEAWIGDAVLALYARSMILSEDGQVDGPKCVRLTSNQFLNALGEPTKVEAEIGRVYQQHGLAVAFEWIENTLLPLFRKQEENRLRKAPRRGS